MISPLVSTPSKLVQMKHNSRHSLTTASRWFLGMRRAKASSPNYRPKCAKSSIREQFFLNTKFAQFVQMRLKGIHLWMS